MLFRAQKKHQGTVSLEETLGADTDNGEVSLSDVVADLEPDMMEQVESTILTDKLIEIIKDNLTSREYKILVMRYGIGGTVAYTQKEVAKKLGISRSYISRLEKKALDIIKKKVVEQKLFEKY